VSAPTPLEVATLRSYALAVRQAARHVDRKHAEQSLERADRMLQSLRKQRPTHWRPLRMAKHAAELALAEPEKALRAADRLLCELPR
jgi:hypothetical protein